MMNDIISILTGRDDKRACNLANFICAEAAVSDRYYSIIKDAEALTLRIGETE